MTQRTVILRCWFCLIIAAVWLAVPSRSSDLSEGFNQDIPADLTNEKTAADLVKSGDEQRDAGNMEEAAAAYREAIHLDPQYEPSHLALASLLNQTGEGEERLEVLFAAHRLLPASAEIAHALMQALYWAQRYDDEIEIGRGYLALQPDDAMAQANLGEAYLKLKQYNNAIEPLEAAIAFDTKKPAALYNLSLAYHLVGRHEDALSILRLMLDGDLELSMRNEAWMKMVGQLELLGRLGEAADETDRELQLNPDSPYALFARGDIHQSRNEFEEAIADWKQAVALPAPNGLKAQIYLSLGNAYSHMSRFIDAIEMANKSVELAPETENYKELLFNCQKLLATAYGASSFCDESLDAIEKAIRLKSDDMSVYNNMSICLTTPGHLEDAEKVLRYAIGLEPDRYEPKYNLSRVLWYQGRFVEAESELRECLRLGTRDWRVFYTYGNLLLKNNNPKEAVSMYRQTLRYGPANPEIMNNLGYILLELNENPEEALDLARRAVRMNPSSAAFRDTLGWAYFKTGKYQEAEKELVLASRRSPETAAIFEHLGDLYEKQGRTIDADLNWKKALSLAGNEEMRARLKTKLSAR